MGKKIDWLAYMSGGIVFIAFVVLVVLCVRYMMFVDHYSLTN